VADKGLREVIAADTHLSDIDGEKGTLSYVGYDIEDLAAHSSFEEVVYLLHHLKLPTASELEGLASFLAEERDLHPFQVQLMGTLAEQTSPMSMLRTSVSAASAFDPDGWDESPDAQARKALRLIAKTASLLTTYHRLRTGMGTVPPNPALPHAADFLWMLHGTEPDPEDARVLDTTFVLYADHTMNASTFTARIVASTLADMFSAITAAIGTLKGPLHGGANEEAMKSFEEVGKPENAEAIERATFDQKGLYPNVDFYAAAVFHVLGIPTDLMTPVFAAARMAGWTAHVREQYADNKVIRPGSRYVGPPNQTWIPLEERG
jgi:citrate synthase